VSLIIAEHLTHAFGAKEVLKDISFRIGQESRVGLVGPNGEGKTTLLRVIAGELEPTIGQVHRAKGVRVGYLPQDPPALTGTTIHAAALDAFADLRRMEADLEKLTHDMSADSANQALIDRYGAMQHEFEARGGYSYTNRIEQVLTGLKFDKPSWGQALSDLSGGQRTRAYLATLLLQEPDVLLLDEPTNHLDMDAVEWLEGWLQSYRGAMVVVSHDRYFLDKVTTSTWEVAWGGVEAYRGAYSHYLTQREERDKERMRKWEEQQEFIAKTEEFIRIHLAGQRTKEAQGRRTRLERFKREEAIERPRIHDSITLRFAAAERTGDFVIRTDNLSVGYDAAYPLLFAGRLEVERGQKVAIVGANGTGKTTLLRTLLGELAPLEGTVRIGAKVNIGYLSQTHAQLEPDWTALYAVQCAGKGITDEMGRSLLGSLLLSGDDALKRISELSGGQRSRVILARLAVQKPSVLMLDEPTNHLDIPSMEIIEDILKRYDGTIIFVSHDRRLVQSVATHVWAIDAGEIRGVRGGWDGYLEWRGMREAGRLEERVAAKAAKEGRKASYLEARKEASEAKRLKRQHEKIEKEIYATEKELEKLDHAITFAGEAGEVSKVSELGVRYQRTYDRLKKLWEDWETLGERIEKGAEG